MTPYNLQMRSFSVHQDLNRSQVLTYERKEWVLTLTGKRKSNQEESSQERLPAPEFSLWASYRLPAPEFSLWAGNRPSCQVTVNKAGLEALVQESSQGDGMSPSRDKGAK
jgi:hypothetical protein